MKRVSHNWVRQQLREGFEELMSLLPEGDEEVVASEYKADGARHAITGGRNPLKLLEDMASFVFALQTLRRASPEEIRAIMMKDGVEGILLGDEYVNLGEKYFD